MKLKDIPARDRAKIMAMQAALPMVPLPLIIKRYMKRRKMGAVPGVPAAPGNFLQTYKRELVGAVAGAAAGVLLGEMLRGRRRR